MDLHAARVQIEKLEQQKSDLSSRAWSLRDKTKKSSQALKEAWTASQRAAIIVTGEE
jgi:predicted  nucleic acid-binding Zn-ribbon protein